MKGKLIMKMMMEADHKVNSGVMPQGTRWRRNNTLVTKLVAPKAGARIGKALRIMSRVIPVTLVDGCAAEVFFPVKIFKQKVTKSQVKAL
jgi:hypothetical protein